MNLQQAKITLEKINRLYQSMTLDSKIDVFEQELMLSYIRQFYRSFSGQEGDLDNGTPTKVIRKTTTVATPEPPKKVVKNEVPVVKPTPPPVVATPKVIPPPVVTPPPVETPPVVIKKEEPVLEVTPPPPPVPKATPTPPTPSKSKAPVEEYDVLFEHKEAKELSDKLAQTPIRDLTKAISINEKILTVQELFGKDNQAFSEAIQKLNGFSNFEEAKPTLAELAHKYKWTGKGKKKKAKVFITLIRRRYN